MAKNRIGMQFDGFEELISKLDSLEGNLKGAVEECLQVSSDIVANELEIAMGKHVRSGRTKETIRKRDEVLWEGTTAKIKVGFSFPEGMASIFLMYGYGTPRKCKDQRVYNAVYGKEVRDKIAKKQEEILHKAIEDTMGG